MRSFGVDVRQSSVLIPLLLIAMLGALFTELLLYKDDLVIKAGYMEELLAKFDAWQYWKEKSLHVNIKYEVM